MSIFNSLSSALKTKLAPQRRPAAAGSRARLINQKRTRSLVSAADEQAALHHAELAGRLISAGERGSRRSRPVFEPPEEVAVREDAGEVQLRNRACFGHNMGKTN